MTAAAGAADAGAGPGQLGGKRSPPLDSPAAFRRCPICGDSLEGQRADARFCSRAHKVEAQRLRRLLAGRPVGRYQTVFDRMAAFRRPRNPKGHTNGRGAE